MFYVILIFITNQMALSFHKHLNRVYFYIFITNQAMPYSSCQAMKNGFAQDSLCLHGILSNINDSGIFFSSLQT